MLDRESTFADDAIIELLRTKFIPIAIDVFYHERRKDAEGEFYRKVVYQREGTKKGRTTQGFYIFAPSGKLIIGWNNRDVPKVLRRLRKAVKKPIALSVESASIDRKDDRRYARTPPKDGLVVDVFSRVMRARHKHKEDASRWNQIFRGALGRDHLWITRNEVESLLKGSWPAALTARITRFHFIDNTRGEPPMWSNAQVTAAGWALEPSKGGHRLTGHAVAGSKDGTRGYDLAVTGRLTSRRGKLTRFDLVARGRYWGGGRYTSNDLPEGRFDFAVAFRIAADDDAAATVPPQGARDINGYLRPR